MKRIICCVLIVLQLTCAIIAYPNDERVISSHPDNDAEYVSIPLRKTIMRDTVASPVGTDDADSDDDDSDDGFAIGGPIGTGSGVSASAFGDIGILTGNGNNNFNSRPSLGSWFPSTMQQPFNFNMNFGLNGFQDLFRNLWQSTALNSFDFGGLDTSPSAKDGEANTTSTIKIIDGKKYIINDTVYTKVSPFGQSVYKIRTVDVQDCNEDDKPEVTTSDDEKNVQNVPEPTTATSSTSKNSSPSVTEDTVDKGSPESYELNNKNNEISKEAIDEDNERDLLRKGVL